MESVVTVIVWAALIQGFLLGLMYITSKKFKSPANKILGLFLWAFVFEAMTSDLFTIKYIWGYQIDSYFTLLEVKLLFPLLYLNYIIEKLGRTEVYRNFLKVHYVLVFLIFGITFLNLILHVFFNSTLIELFSFNRVDSFFMMFQYYAFILSIFAVIISFKETLRYQKIVQNEFSDSSMLHINWLWQFNFVILPIIILWGVELIRILIGGQGTSDVVLATWFFVFLFLYYVSYRSYHNPNLFENVPLGIRKQIGIDHKDTSKPTCNLEQIERIQTAMIQDSSYLNSELTIHSFAKEINISPRLISSYVNQNLGLNFNEWVNRYRVEKALSLIQSDSNNLLSIEGIGSDAGFKSRSAMYAAFKKKLGNSPGNYREI